MSLTSPASLCLEARSKPIEFCVGWFWPMQRSTIKRTIAENDISGSRCLSSGTYFAWLKWWSLDSEPPSYCILFFFFFIQSRPRSVARRCKDSFFRFFRLLQFAIFFQVNKTYVTMAVSDIDRVWFQIKEVMGTCTSLYKGKYSNKKQYTKN